MKNLKKLSKGQLKTITGAGGVQLPEPELCLYACNGIVVCAACSDDFKCPVDDM